MDERALLGTRVLDLTSGRAGAYAGRLLADAGADVVVIEPEGGASLRRYGASPGSVGLLFEYLRGGTRSVVVEPDIVRALYSTADIVIDDSGLDPDAVLAANPAAVMVSISPFGRSGPWSDRPGNEFTVQALAGGTSTRGTEGREYVNGQGRVGEWLTGVVAAVLGLAARRRALETGLGEHIDVSMLEVVNPTCTNLQSVWGAMSGVTDTVRLRELPSIEPTADGYVGFCIFTGQQWQDFCLLIDQPELIADESLSTMGGRIQQAERIEPLIQQWTRSRTTDEVIEAAIALRIPVAPIGNGATVPALGHIAERGVYRQHPTLGFLQPRPPYRIDGREPPPIRTAPAIGEHTRQILVEATRTETANSAAGRQRIDIDSLSTGHPPALPLAGLRIVDLTQFWAGPWGGFLLAALGAEVIHVESIQRPDGMRFGSVKPPGSDQWWEWGPTFAASNLGKRSVTLDLGRPEGRDLLRRLVEHSDALIENFSPRVIDQFGLGWENVSAWNDQLVMVRMPAFGLDGPWRDRVAFAQTMEQLSGMSWVTGYADGPPLLARGPADPLAGSHAVFALLVALEQRRRTGRGAFVEATMVETALVAAAEQVIEHSATGTLLERSGNDHPDAEFQTCIPCQPDPTDQVTTGWLAVSAETSDHLGRLRALLGGADVESWAKGRTVDDAVEQLHAAGVPAAPIVKSRASNRHPQYDARRFFRTIEHAVTGRHRYPGLPARFASLPDDVVDAALTAAPTLGQHNDAVLGGILGLAIDELAALAEAKIIGTRPLGA